MHHNASLLARANSLESLWPRWIKNAGQTTEYKILFCVFSGDTLELAFEDSSRCQSDNTKTLRSQFLRLNQKGVPNFFCQQGNVVNVALRRPRVGS